MCRRPQMIAGKLVSETLTLSIVTTVLTDRLLLAVDCVEHADAKVSLPGS